MIGTSCTLGYNPIKLRNLGKSQYLTQSLKSKFLNFFKGIDFIPDQNVDFSLLKLGNRQSCYHWDFFLFLSRCDLSASRIRIFDAWKYHYHSSTYLGMYLLHNVAEAFAKYWTTKSGYIVIQNSHPICIHVLQHRP